MNDLIFAKICEYNNQQNREFRFSALYAQYKTLIEQHSLEKVTAALNDGGLNLESMAQAKWVLTEVEQKGK